MKEQILDFFEYDYLDPYLHPISQLFHEMAWDLVGRLPNNEEKRVALRKLLEAKDAAVRSAITKRRYNYRPEPGLPEPVIIRRRKTGEAEE